MGTPGSERLVKAGFVVMNSTTGAVVKVIVFQYNPETLVRRLTAGSVGTTGGSSVPGNAGVTQTPQETVNFTISLDATDLLERGDALTQQDGLLPILSALELLLYPQTNTFIVWVSGQQRTMPVRITDMAISEQVFDPMLNPIRADIAVSLQVLKDADLGNNASGRAIWDGHYAVLQKLSQAYGSGALSALGITSV